MSDQNEFERWRTLWRISGGKNGEPFVDAQQVKSRVATRRRRTVFKIIVAVLVTGMLLFLSGLPTLRGIHHLAQLGVLLSLSSVWGIGLAFLRDRATKADEPSTSVKEAIRDAVQEEREGRLGRLFGALALVAVLASIALAREQRIGPALIGTPQFPVIVLVCLFGLLWILQRINAKRQARLQYLRELDREFEALKKLEDNVDGVEKR